MDIETRLNIIRRLCYKYKEAISFLGYTLNDFVHELYVKYEILREVEEITYLNRNTCLRIIDLIRFIGGRPGDNQKNRFPVLYEHQFRPLNDESQHSYIFLSSQIQDNTIKIDNEDFCDYLLSRIGNPRDRQILILYYYKDLQMKEIAEIYNISESSVSVIIGNIINMFKRITNGY